MYKRIARMASTQDGVLRAQFLCGLTAGLVIAASASIAVYGASRPYLPSTAALAAFAASIAAGLVAAQAFLDTAGWLGQRGRDLAALNLWTSLNNGRAPNRPFLLYLLPFASTDEIASEHGAAVAVRAPGVAPTVWAATADRLEAEAVLEETLRPIGRLIALGQPLEHLGAGRIATKDATWREDIELLMDAATLIILLPSSRPGTIWEIDRILLNDRLKKTIIIDPPNQGRRGDSDYDHAAEWETVRRSFAAHGYDLPEDDEDGMMMRFDGVGAPAALAKLSLDQSGAIRRFAKQAISQRA